jgi:hypothetical protein
VALSNADIWAREGRELRRSRNKRGNDSIWTRELIPPDSIWRRELIPEDSILRKDLFAFAGRREPRCTECPILILAEEHRCNKYDRIPDEIWDGFQTCPLYQEREIEVS